MASADDLPACRCNTTSRLFPDFLNPGGVIRLDYLQEAHEAARNNQTNDRLCEILGGLDDRTLRRHLARYDEAAGEVVLRLAEGRAMSPELGELPQSTPDIDSADRLRRLWQVGQIASQRRSESVHSTNSSGDATVDSCLDQLITQEPTTRGLLITR